MINLEKAKKAYCLFHTGLLLFSIAPALILSLILLSAGSGIILSISAGVFIIAVFQICGILYEKRGGNPITLRMSFWTLKALQSVSALPVHAPEKMVVAMNNRKALSEVDRKFNSDETLILVPHCLQNHECLIRLTFNPDSCERCGKCPIGKLIDIKNRFGTHFAIASGGTSARRIVEKIRPSLIIAVACPVDLSLGILDVHPITTVGVLVEWRNGPCFDTWVNTDELEAALALFLDN